MLAPTVLQDTWCREVAAVSTARFAAVKRGTSAKTMRTLNDAHFVFVSHRMLVSGNAYALSPAINWPYIIRKYTADGMCPQLNQRCSGRGPSNSTTDNVYQRSNSGAS